MRVLALIESAGHVCYRYRLNALAWDLAQEGLFLEARPFGKGLARIADLLAARRAEIVILQRKLLPAWQLALLRRMAKCLVYDVDDALFRRDSFSSKPQHSTDRLGRFRSTVRAADAVLAGNDYLAQFASVFTHPNRVHLVPTSLDPGWYPTAIHERIGSQVRLAWIGQSAMLPSLAASRERLTAISRRLPDVTLWVICDALPNIAGLRCELRPWTTDTETGELAAADIGISWLCNDLWSLGKCGLKVLQYMAAGLPVVANPVGIHRKLVVPGETGFLAETPDEWADAVSRLAEDPVLRSRMGTAARRRVEAEFNVCRLGPQLAGLLRNLVGRHEATHPKVSASDTCHFEPTSGKWAR